LTTWIGKESRIWLAQWRSEAAPNDQFTLEMLALGAGAMPLIGTREQVAEKLVKLYENGLEGELMCFLSYLEDTVRFREEIVPLLRQLGVRH
jgi:alkanesulfonate monooxygenase SsuD/methylene tetrahydromethanopterin reductase-like flavin-dependent oxidoreductase (luciferase family)